MIYLQAERVRDFVRKKRTYNIDENYEELKTPVKTCKIALMQRYIYKRSASGMLWERKGLIISTKTTNGWKPPSKSVTVVPLHWILGPEPWDCNFVWGLPAFGSTYEAIGSTVWRTMHVTPRHRCGNWCGFEGVAQTRSTRRGVSQNQK